MYKKDLIKVTVMKACRKMRWMRIDPYPDALIRQGLHKKEPKETADPILEDTIMYTVVVGMELMEGLVMVQDTVDRMALETSERKVEVDRALVWLHHQMGQRDDCLAIIDKWKEDVTGHMRDIGEAQGSIWGRLREAELHLDQHQALAVAQCREIDLLGGVVLRQSEVIDIQCRLLLEMEADFNWKLGRLERIVEQRRVYSIYYMVL